jgi:hypothetical protein
MRKPSVIFGLAALLAAPACRMHSAEHQADGSANGDSARVESIQPPVQMSPPVAERQLARRAAQSAPEAKVGEIAPDFSLTPLKLYDFMAGDRQSDRQTAAGLFEPIALSAFRNKKPVALIFGSYT